MPKLSEAAMREAVGHVRMTALRDLLELYDHAAGGENWTVEQTIRLAEIRTPSSGPHNQETQLEAI